MPMPRSFWCASTASARPGRDAGGNRHHREQHRGLQAVEEITRREDVFVLVEAHVGARQPGEGWAAVQAEIHAVDQRIEDEDAEDQQRREQQAGTRARAPSTSCAVSDDAIVDATVRHVTGRSGCRTSGSNTCSASGSAIRCTTLSGAGTSACGTLADDHELAVGEAARDVALVPERLRPRRPSAVTPPSSPRRRSSGRTPSTTFSEPGRFDGVGELRGERRPSPGELHDEAVADTRRRGRRRCSSADCR